MPRDSAASDELAWLERWYASRCDGEWEHRYGIRIESCDNPGWWVRIDLNKEPPERCAERTLIVEGDRPRAENGNVGGSEWMTCDVKDGKFDGAGDATKLTAIIRCFREMVAGPVDVPVGEDPRRA